MPRDRTDTLAYRAAVYFGVEREPRTSIKTGPQACLLVVRREPGYVVLAAYNEATRPAGCTYVALKDAQAEALREALFFGGEVADDA